MCPLIDEQVPLALEEDTADEDQRSDYDRVDRPRKRPCRRPEPYDSGYHDEDEPGGEEHLAPLPERNPDRRETHGQQDRRAEPALLAKGRDERRQREYREPRPMQ